MSAFHFLLGLNGTERIFVGGDGLVQSFQHCLCVTGAGYNAYTLLRLLDSIKALAEIEYKFKGVVSHPEAVGVISFRVALFAGASVTRIHIVVR